MTRLLTNLRFLAYDLAFMNLSLRCLCSKSTSGTFSKIFSIGNDYPKCSFSTTSTKQAKSFSKEELKKHLTRMQFEVTQNAGTERAFTGEYWDNHQKGTYKCVVCDEDLFLSNTKYESGSGWPSFFDVIDKSKIKLIRDHSYGMVRTEVVCSKCKAHLGHLFDDGPKPTRQRYCMNSASLNFIEGEK